MRPYVSGDVIILLCLTPNFASVASGLQTANVLTHYLSDRIEFDVSSEDPSSGFDYGKNTIK